MRRAIFPGFILTIALAQGAAAAPGANPEPPTLKELIVGRWAMPGALPIRAEFARDGTFTMAVWFNKQWSTSRGKYEVLDDLTLELKHDIGTLRPHYFPQKYAVRSTRDEITIRGKTSPTLRLKRVK